MWIASPSARNDGTFMPRNDGRCTFNNFLIHNLKNSIKTPSFVIISILFEVFIAINFFIRQQFFTGSGTTDLILFFSAVPYICIIAVPALCYKQSFSIYEDFTQYYELVGKSSTYTGDALLSFLTLQIGFIYVML
jgi:hypothetical protein